jgi:hypothetical protein
MACFYLSFNQFTKTTKEMIYTFEITSAASNWHFHAQLLDTANNIVNAKTHLTVNTEYIIETSALKEQPKPGSTYIFTGSWIPANSQRIELHATSITEILAEAPVYICNDNDCGHYAEVRILPGNKSILCLPCFKKKLGIS